MPVSTLHRVRISRPYRYIKMSCRYRHDAGHLPSYMASGRKLKRGRSSPVSHDVFFAFDCDRRHARKSFRRRLPATADRATCPFDFPMPQATGDTADADIRADARDSLIIWARLSNVCSVLRRKLIRSRKCQSFISLSPCIASAPQLPFARLALLPGRDEELPSSMHGAAVVSRYARRCGLAMKLPTDDIAIHHSAKRGTCDGRYQRASVNTPRLCVAGCSRRPRCCRHRARSTSMTCCEQARRRRADWPARYLSPHRRKAGDDFHFSGATGFLVLACKARD